MVYAEPSVEQAYFDVAKVFTKYSNVIHKEDVEELRRILVELEEAGWSRGCDDSRYLED